MAELIYSQFLSLSGDIYSLDAPEKECPKSNFNQ